MAEPGASARLHAIYAQVREDNPHLSPQRAWADARARMESEREQAKQAAQSKQAKSLRAPPVDERAAAGGRDDLTLDDIRWCAAWVSAPDPLPPAPSRAAAGLLAWARSSPQALSEFWRTFGARLVPKDGAQEAERSERRTRRHAQLSTTLDRLLAMRDDALAQAVCRVCGTPVEPRAGGPIAEES